MQRNKLQEEFIRLINRHQGLIHKVCHLYAHSLHDREDLFQEIVVQLWKSFHAFRGESKYSTWLYRIALNTAISAFRKQQRSIDLVFPERIPADYSELSTAPGPEDELTLLYHAISHLSDIEKAVVMLYLEDKSYEEMEEVLGINQGTLRVKMTRIKEKLRQLTKAASYGT